MVQRSVNWQILLIFSSNVIFVGLTMIMHDEHTWIMQVLANRLKPIVAFDWFNDRTAFLAEIETEIGLPTGVTTTFAQFRQVFGCKTKSPPFDLTYLVYFPFVFFAYIHSLLVHSFRCLLVFPGKVKWNCFICFEYVGQRILYIWTRRPCAMSTYWMTAGAFGLEQPGNTVECLGTLVRFVSARISNDNGDGCENVT